MRSLTIHNAVITLNGKELPERVDVTVEFQEAKVWDITPPLGWNWDSDDWRIYNFVRDLDSHGGVVRGELFDEYVLIRYNKRKPSKSLILVERESNGRVQCHVCKRAIHISEFGGACKDGLFHSGCFVVSYLLGSHDDEED